MAFMYVKRRTFHTHFVESFIINGCWILSNAASASIEMIMWFFFSFILLIWCKHLDWFVTIKPALNPWNKSHFIMFMILYYIVELGLLIILLRILSSMFTVYSLIRFSVSSWFILAVLCVSRNVSVTSVLPFVCVLFFLVYSDELLYFYGVSYPSFIYQMKFEPSFFSWWV